MNRTLNRAINQLSRYNGLFTSRDLARDLSTLRNTRQERGLPTNQGNSNELDFTPDPEVEILIELLINTSEGGITTQQLIKKINESLTRTSAQQFGGSTNQQRFNRIVRIFYAEANQESLTITGNNNNSVSINGILGISRGSLINSSPRTPTKEKPGLSLIQVNTSLVHPSIKNVNAITLFMNSIPTIELSKAIPFIDIQFQTAREPLGSGRRIQTLSLIKFLEGATTINDNSPNKILVNSTVITGSIQGQERSVATAGMELFTSPQTLINANERFDPVLRSAPVIDKFRPLMSLKELTLEVAPSTGLMSFKSGKIELTLHDKSRLSEVADFVSPNLYGATEMLIEYGWSHSDSSDKNNYYADIINGMRLKEKYGLVNSSFTSDDSGQMNITLNIAMRGATETHTETISSAEDLGITNTLRRIEEIARTIGELRRRIFRNNVPATREIRGSQILDAAQDARGHLIFDSSLRDALRQFQNSIRNSTRGNPQLAELSRLLNELYVNNGRSNRTSQATNLRNSIRTSIERKFAALTGTQDIPSPPIARPADEQSNNRPQRVRGRRTGRSEERNNNISRVSLGKLLLLFIGVPLANTQKFDDVQLVFYPFNSFAALARDRNISQFTVDVNYFIEQYTEFRLNHVSRSANLTLREFLQFIAQTIIDDNAAQDYGLQDIFRHTRNRNSNSNSSEPQRTETVGNLSAVDVQTRIDRRLRGITPDGTFKMPQVDFYLECLPENPSLEETGRRENSNLKSILKIHIFDRQASAYETEAQLISAMRDEELSTIGNIISNEQTGEPGIRESQESRRRRAIDRAVSLGIIEAINNPSTTNVQTSTTEGDTSTNPPLRGLYRIRGGQQQLKEFLKRTTPYILHGAGGSMVRSANLSSMQDPQLSTVNLLRSLRSTPLEPNGEQPGGLPLQTIPAELSLESLGCPLIEFSQQFYYDGNTGTTLDDIYGVVGLTHSIGPGKFNTTIKMVPLNAYGRYTSLIEKIGVAGEVLRDIDSQQTQSNNAQQTGRAPRRR